jgi:hypothetical protein
MRRAPMPDHLFVPQTVLDKWSEQGRIRVDGTVLTILGDGKDFDLTNAVRFIKLEAGEDSAGLLQKVKTTEALKQMGAEHYLASVLLGEVAYQVQQGYLADAHALRRAADVSHQALAQKPSAEGAHRAQPAHSDAKKSGEQDMLARYLLDNL